MPRSIARRKTKKSVIKRIKITGTGKLMRRKPGLRHLASSKTSKQKRKLGKDGQVHETMVDRIKECQAKLEDYFTNRKAPLLDKLANEKKLDNVEADLKTALEDFKSSWK